MDEPVRRVLDALSAAGKKVHKSSNGWEAQCPGHDDKNSSLSLHRSETGNAILHCHAGCETDAVTQSLGLKMRDLFAEKSQTKKAVSSEKQSAGKLVAEYVYANERGERLLRVTRHEPKSFMRWRPAGSADAWKPGGTAGIPEVPYRLPQVLAAIARVETIYVVEGEKDVHALEELGVVATCNSGGAGTRAKPRWTPAHSVLLKGAHQVVILPDNDSAGLEHAASIAESLANEEIPWRVALWPSADESGSRIKDAHDWVHAGAAKTREQLEQLIAAAPDWTPPAAAEKKSGLGQDGHAGPVPLPGRPPPAPFPLDALPEVLRQFCLELAEELQVPVDAPAMLSLAVIALAVAKKARVNVWANWFEPLCIWALMASEPGTKKSAIYERVLRPVKEWERGEELRLKTEIAKSASLQKVMEKRIKKLETSASSIEDEAERNEVVKKLEAALKEKEAMAPVVKPRLYAADATMESLADLAHRHGGRIGIFGPESRKLMAIIVGKYDSKASAADFELLLNGHAGEDVLIDRVNRGEFFIQRATISLGLMAQPSVLQKLKAADEGSGLAARFAYAVPEYKKPSDTLVRAPRMRDGVRDNFKGLVSRLLEWKPAEEQLVRCSEQAEREMEAFRKSVNERMDPGAIFARDQRLKEWASKLAGLAGRIAGLLHLTERAFSDDKVTGGISGTTMAAAIKIAEYLAQHAMRAFDVMEDDEAWLGAHAIYAWLLKKDIRVFTENLLMHRGPGRWRRAEKMRAALKVLEERGLIECTAEERRGYNLPFVVRTPDEDQAEAA